MNSNDHVPSAARSGVLTLESIAPFMQHAFARRILPFALIGCAAYPVAIASGAEPTSAAMLAAVGFFMLALTTAIVISVLRLPRHLDLAPPIVYLASMAALLHATGGAASPFSVFALLAVVWAALYHRAWEVAVLLGAFATVLFVPIALIGGPTYPPTQLWHAGAVTVVAALIGFVLHRLVSRIEVDATTVADTLEHALDAFVSYGADGRITAWNRRAGELLGWTAAETIGRPAIDFVPAAARPTVTQALRAAADARTPFSAHATRRDGSTFPAEWSVAVVRSPRGAHYDLFIRDVSERERADEALRASEARFRSAFESAPTGMALAALDGQIEMVNSALCRQLGYSRERLLQLSIADLTHPEDRGSDALHLQRLVDGWVNGFEIDKRYLHRDGSVVWAATHVTVVPGSDGRPAHLIGQLLDITERRRLDDQLRTLADHEPLTGLANRRAFEREMNRHVLDASHLGAMGALLLIDLDNFKSVNDTFGHSAGDALLVAVGGVLKSRIGAADVVGRLGGDEFAVLLGRAHGDEAQRVAKSMLAEMRSVAARISRVPVTISIGIAPLTEREMSGSEWLKRADLAMYTAKHAGGDRYEVFDLERTGPSDCHDWYGRITTALAHDALIVDAMPIVNLRTRAVDRYELLVRMRGSDGAMMPPSSFLPVAEQFGLIGRIDRWMTLRAIELLDERRAAPVALSVNLSGQSITDEGFLVTLERALRDHNVDPGFLTFELTESAAVIDLAATQRFATNVRRLGCELALDDFGIGYAPLAYLKHLPFDYLNIDGQFVTGCAHDNTDQVIIESLVDLARRLGKRTRAKYASNQETLQMLRTLGVDYAQGACIGMPAAVREVLPTSAGLRSEAGAA